nr:hypothetical protein [Chroococcidiopsis sp. SAG 2025]
MDKNAFKTRPDDSVQAWSVRVGRANLHLLDTGVDLWLNTPLRPQEASGTSGQKVCFNGALIAVFSMVGGAKHISREQMVKVSTVGQLAKIVL